MRGAPVVRLASRTTTNVSGAKASSLGAAAVQSESYDVTSRFVEQTLTHGANALSVASEEVHATVSSGPVLTKSEIFKQRVSEAKLRGYEGVSCSECHNFTMVRNGTCLKCDTCGSTSGCS